MLSAKILLRKNIWFVSVVVLLLGALATYLLVPCGSTCSVDTFEPDVTVSMEDTTPKTVVFAMHDPLDREMAKWWVNEAENYQGFCGMAWVSHVEAVKNEVPKARRGMVWSIAWSMAKEKQATAALDRLASFAAFERDWNDSEFILTVEQELEDPTSLYWPQAIQALGDRDILHVQLADVAKSNRDGAKEAAALLAD